MTPVADPPLVTTQDAVGVVNSTIPLGITAALVDEDGSEMLTVQIDAVPGGASLSAGTDLGNGLWQIDPVDLNGLAVTPALDDDSDFTLSVMATATETGNGDQGMTIEPLLVRVLPTEIHADGFESGDTSGWSSTIP